MPEVLDVTLEVTQNVIHHFHRPMTCFICHPLPVVLQDVLGQVESFGDARAHGVDQNFTVPSVEELPHNLEEYRQVLTSRHIDLILRCAPLRGPPLPQARARRAGSHR